MDGEAALLQGRYDHRREMRLYTSSRGEQRRQGVKHNGATPAGTCVDTMWGARGARGREQERSTERVAEKRVVEVAFSSQRVKDGAPSWMTNPSLAAKPRHRPPFSCQKVPQE